MRVMRIPLATVVLAFAGTTSLFRQGYLPFGVARVGMDTLHRSMCPAGFL
jgi:hypothetical protein